MDSKELSQNAIGAEASLSAAVSLSSTSTSVATSTSSTSSTATSSTQKQLSSSPAPGVPKILSRNANGTLVLTSSPSNEAELQLYRVMQRASLLAYYDTLLEMGGDDVQQLCDAGEEEFLEIMALVGMASKPLHVRRLQKALQEWVTNPALFQTPLISGIPTSPTGFPHLGGIRSLGLFSGLPLPIGPIPSTATGNHLNNHISLTTSKESSQSQVRSAPSPVHNQAASSEVNNHRENNCSWSGPNPSPGRGPSLSPGPSSGQSPGSPLQLTPVLVESQISRLAEAAETLVKNLPQFEPKPHNTKKKICKDLENVMNMSEEDPRRMEEIRKYAAIYGRFDCKRKPEKPLTLHEVSVNEAAAQICRFVPALLTRRDELFPLARQVVRDSGYHYSKGHSSLAPMYRTHSYNTNNHRNGDDSHVNKRAKIDSIPSPSQSCNDLTDVDRSRRQERLEQIADELRTLGERTEDLVHAAQQVRDTNDVSAIQTLQQQMEAVQSKQTQLLIEQSDLLKQPLPMRFYRRNSNKTSNYGDPERPDTDDTDSQFSFSNASSPSQEVGDSRDSLLRDGDNGGSGNGTASVKSPGKHVKQFSTENLTEDGVRLVKDYINHQKDTEIYDNYYLENKVQVISASGGNIIAVANPALSMSSAILPTSDTINLQRPRPESPLSLKIERQSPQLINHKPD